ncbi:MAG: hypothetical protein Kow00129_07330 [Thermoleophilia bacterium]
MTGDGSERLTNFVDEFVFSFEAWDILAFFAANPGGGFSLAELSRSIGRHPEELVPTVEKLAELGALVPAGDGHWILGGDSDFRSGLQDFADAIDSKKGRLLVLTRLLGNLSR